MPSQISFILYLVDFKHLKVNDYIYPDWAYGLGWIMTLSSVLMVPLWAAGQMCLTAGTFRQVSVHLLQPKQYAVGDYSHFNVNQQAQRVERMAQNISCNYPNDYGNV